MDLGELFDVFKRRLAPSQTVYAEPGLTYGPQETRVSHTPVNYTTDMDPTMAGVYDAPLSSIFTFGKARIGPGQITINPKSDMYFRGSDAASGANSAVTHEQAHAILNPLGNDALEKLSSSATGYDAIASGLTKKYGRQGWMPAEVPSYMAEAWQEYPGGKEWIDSFITHLKGVDPMLAQQYAKGAHYTQNTTEAQAR